MSQNERKTNLSVSPLILFTLIVLDRLVPRPHIIHELLVLLLRWVELNELITFIIWSHVEGWEGLVATDDEGTTDNGVVGDTVNGGGTEDVLAAGLETGEETT